MFVDSKREKKTIALIKNTKDNTMPKFMLFIVVLAIWTPIQSHAQECHAKITCEELNEKIIEIEAQQLPRDANSALNILTDHMLTLNRIMFEMQTRPDMNCEPCSNHLWQQAKNLREKTVEKIKSIAK